MKVSEARILVYLDQVSPWLRYANKISEKLKMHYAYTHKLLKEMVEKGWVNKHHLENKILYIITTDAPLEESKSILASRFGVPPWERT